MFGVCKFLVDFSTIRHSTLHTYSPIGIITKYTPDRCISSLIKQHYEEPDNKMKRIPNFVIYAANYQK